MKRNELRAMLLEQPYDALVLTSEISRRYATGFHSTAGAVYLRTNRRYSSRISAMLRRHARPLRTLRCARLRRAELFCAYQ